MVALKRYSRTERSGVAREWARRSNALSEKRAARGVDADTLRWRAMEDARGETLREGRDYSAGVEKHWLIRRSVRGRIDSVDLLRDGRLFRTGGIDQAAHAVKWGVWKLRPCQR